MNILETYYTYAKLSQAAYIDLSAVANPLDKQAIVIAAASPDQKRVTEALAKDIFGVDATGTDYWTMLSPYYRTGTYLGLNNGHSDPASGFAGMLLSNPTYGKVLAIARTKGVSFN